MKLKLLKTVALFILISNSIYAQTGNTFFGSNSGISNTSGDNNSFFGHNSGQLNSTGIKNVFLGCNSGKNNITGNSNTFIGNESGISNDNGELNVAIGSRSLYRNVSSSQNTAIGVSSLQNLETGGFNVSIGYFSLKSLTVGINNIAVGRAAGLGLISGNNNTFIGYASGSQNTNGTGNVFMGYYSGALEQGSNKFYIANGANDNKLLLYGDFSTKQLAIGTKNIPTNILTSQGDNYALFVPRGILTDEVKVRTGWADYVFEDSYELPSLKEEAEFIKSNGHLMNFPSANEIEEAGGVDLGKMVVLQQETIEKMMLHIIQLEEKLEDLASQ